MASATQLAGNLGAGRQGAEKKVSRAGGGTRSPDPRVGLRLVDCPPDVHGAGDQGVLLASLRPERYPGRAALAAVLFLQRLVHGLEIQVHPSGIAAL